MLTDLVRLLPPAVAHFILRLLGVEAETFHDWLEGMCPCGAGSSETPR